LDEQRATLAAGRNASARVAVAGEYGPKACWHDQGVHVGTDRPVIHLVALVLKDARPDANEPFQR